MNNKIIRSYNVALIGAIIVGVSFIIGQFLDYDQFRRIRGIIGWFVNAPTLFIGLLAAIMSINEFRRKKITKRQFIRAVPMILILGYFAVMFIAVLIKVLFY